MTEILIAWVLIGTVHFAGFLLEVLEVKSKPWTCKTSLLALSCLAVMLLLWPFDQTGTSRRCRRG